MRTVVALAFASALAAGCASPDTRYYTLDPVAAPQPPAADYAVAVGPVTVPELLDRPQIVVSLGPNRVAVDDFNRWASPVQDEIARTVAANLASLLGASRVSLFPRAGIPEGGYRVAVDVLRMESVPGEAATLDAAWTVTRTRDAAVRRGRATLRELAAAAGFDALAAAHSRAVGRMSEDIAAAIRGLGK